MMRNYLAATTDPTSSNHPPGTMSQQPPHHGALCRYGNDDFETETYHRYVIEIKVVDGNDEQQQQQQQESELYHQLYYTRKDFAFAERLFAILDTESKGLVERGVIEEFVTLRCPVFWRRDEDLKRLAGQSISDPNDEGDGDESSPTFNEIWNSVISCSKSGSTSSADDDAGILSETVVGVEGFIVFCRFVALAQYLEAKRRFSARHLQQTMRHRNSPRGSEVVVVDVPPPTPPAPLSPLQLARYERQSKAPLPLPELDLDHSLLAAHDMSRGGGRAGRGRRSVFPGQHEHGTVKISVFGPSTTSSFSTGLMLNTPGSSSSSVNNTEFAVTYTRSSPFDSSAHDEVVVRRSMADMKWLNDTFASHKDLGGTLCGRILPPFPGTTSSSSGFKKDDSVAKTLKTTGGAITAAAASGVGRVKNLAVSLFGSYLNNGPSSIGTSSTDDSATAHPSPRVSANKHSTSGKKSAISRSSRIYSGSYCSSNSPACRARQLERYLNYLLEHPALSTSFALNTILKASQSGLDAAKESLEEITRARKELKEQTPQLDDGKVSIPFWPCAAGESSNSPNLTWVRTAAQAAMALRVHGMLETTGMNSASARLQHASLPSFGTAARSPSWDDDDDGNRHRAMQGGDTNEVVGAVGDIAGANNFEEGVVSVQSELDSEEYVVDGDGYDLLPLPVPAPERRILNAGSDAVGSSSGIENRFHYGTSQCANPLDIDLEKRPSNAYLGDVSVDENIDKLREVIGSVDNTLSRCLASLGGIVKAQRKRQALHLEIVKGLDSWSGMRGKFVSQRSLLKGVTGIEQSRSIYDEGDVAMIDDVSWQTSLASSAVSAAEDVRSAVRVSRTAANAKAAASSAAFAAQSACESGTFDTIDEARAAQTRASIAQSHAIHAAVVEHEAKSVKRRATLALAHDVKVWNVHRKRELHRACVAYARSQHEATRRAVDAWSSLRDGFIGTSTIPSAHERRHVAPVPTTLSEQRRGSSSMADSNEATATIYEDAPSTRTTDGQVAIVAVDHNALSNTPTPKPTAIMEPPNVTDGFDSGLILPFATAAPITEEEEEEFGSSTHTNSQHNSTFEGGGTISDHPALEKSERSCTSKNTDSNNNEILSGSMQSLVDGLMSWGGGFDAEEDHFALPAGMAASIVLEAESAYKQ